MWLRFGPFALGFLIATTGPSIAATAQEQEPIPWRDNYLAALKEATREGRPVLMCFSADWCAPCREMEATTFRDAEVVAAAREFVPLKVAFYSGSGLASKFSVVSIPNMILLDGDGNRITGLRGYQTPERVLRMLQPVREEYTTYLRDMSEADDFAAARRVAAFLVKVRNSPRAVDVLESALKKVPRSDAVARSRAELDVAEAREISGDLVGAAQLFGKVSNAGSDREIRAKALVRLASVERRRGRPGKSAEALDRLAREYPDLQKGAFQSNDAVESPPTQ